MLGFTFGLIFPDSVTSRKNWIFSSATVKTLNIARQKRYVVLKKFV